jgi:transcriptional regulator with XRE-family HTH domain
VQVPAIQFLRERLKKLRKRHLLTQEQFAEIANINYKFYQSIESGRHCEIRLSTLKKLSDAYGVRLDQLLSPVVPKTHVQKSGKTPSYDSGS